MVHVPYRGAAPALTDLLGGQVQVYFGPMPSSIEYIKTGRLRALAVTTATRSETLPDLPTVGEFVPGYEASTWFGVGAPKATPAEIVEKLNKEINAGLADPKIKARLADLGGTVLAGSPADFGKLIANETEKWAKVIGRPTSGLSNQNADLVIRTFPMSASLIGRLGSSAFRLSTVAVSMSLAGSCFSPESAPRPFHHGIRGRGGTIFRAALPSRRWSGQADIRTHLIHRPARDTIPPHGGAQVFSDWG